VRPRAKALGTNRLLSYQQDDHDIATWAKLFREGRMKDEDLRRQLGRVFESYLNGRPKDLNRVVTVEMQAIKLMRAD
jgi:hypothetical protein